MDKQKKSEDKYRAELDETTYRIAREKGTERAFTGKYHDHKGEGVYRCAVCGMPLFSSETKYDSGSGWPSFYAPIDDQNVEEERDLSHGMVRQEVVCARCESHLGHVFPDGPDPTGMRYCVNSAVLRFDPDADPADPGDGE